jgi:hypothetical protein
MTDTQKRLHGGIVIDPESKNIKAENVVVDMNEKGSNKSQR